MPRIVPLVLRAGFVTRGLGAMPLQAQARQRVGLAREGSRRWLRQPSPKSSNARGVVEECHPDSSSTIIVYPDERTPQGNNEIDRAVFAVVSSGPLCSGRCWNGVARVGYPFSYRKSFPEPPTGATWTASWRSTQMTSRWRNASYPKHLHHLVAQVVDDLHGDASGRRLREGAGGVAV